MTHRFSEWSDDPGQWTAFQLLDHAASEGDEFGSYRGASSFDWKYDPSVDVRKLLTNAGEDKPLTNREWRKWYEEERKYRWMDDPTDDYYDQMERWYRKNPSDLPIVVFWDLDEDGRGGLRIAGGHHRVGIAHKYKMWHVPAVVGTPR